MVEQETKKKTKTTIQIERKTLSRLKAFKMVNKESYDELLNRLLDRVVGEKR